MSATWYDDQLMYDFDYKYRGLAVVIVIKNFPLAPHLKKRRGSHNDLKMMTKFFKALDFKVRCYKDLTGAQVLSTLKKASLSPLNRDSDCFACVISTHGEELLESKVKYEPQTWKQYMYGSDGGSFTVDEVMAMFSQENCPSLKGKPKMFFLQACRSRKGKCMYDYGSLLKVINSKTESEKAKQGNKGDHVDKPEDKIEIGRDNGESPTDNGTKGDNQETEHNLHKGDNFNTTVEESVLRECKPLYVGIDDGMPVNEWNEYNDTDTDDEDEDEEVEEEDIRVGPDTNPPPAPPPKPFDGVQVPCPKDCLIMSPIGTGKTAFRNARSGSWMLYYLHKHLRELLQKRSFISYLTLINGHIARDYEYNPKPLPAMIQPDDSQHLPFKMVGSIVHRLTADICFNPKEKDSLMDKLIKTFLKLIPDL